MRGFLIAVLLVIHAEAFLPGAPVILGPGTKHATTSTLRGLPGAAERGNGGVPAGARGMAYMAGNQNSASGGSGSSGEGEWRTEKRERQQVVAPRQRVGGKATGVRETVKTQGQKWGTIKPKPPAIRVSSGTAKGRKLKTPDVYLRPMMGKVKEALFSFFREFNALNEDAVFLDTFAGCGSVGIEALSQGVGRAVFIDYSNEACSCIRSNLETCGFSDQGFVINSPAERFYADPSRILAQLQRPYFDVVSITPPYEEVVYSDLLSQIAKSENLVGDGSLIVVEYPVELGLLPPVIAGRMVGMKNRRYGRTMLAVYCIRPDGDLTPRPEEFAPVEL